MSLFKYKPKKKSAQSSTGWSHGLAFKDDKTSWVIPLEMIQGVLVVGSKADDIGSRVVKALKQTCGETMTIDFKGEGLTSIESNTETAINLREATDLLAKIKQNSLMSLQTKLEKSVQGKSKGLITAIKGNNESKDDAITPPLLVINGLKPRDLKEFDPGNDGSGETGVMEKPDLDASIESIGASREALSELVDNDLIGSIESVIKAAQIDTVPAVVVRWSLVLRITEAEGKMAPEEIEAAGKEGLTLNGDEKLPLPDDPVIIDAIEALKERENEDLESWAERLSHDLVTAQAALALTQCDSRLGLPWDPVGGFEEQQKAIRVLRSAVEAGRVGRRQDLTPLQRLWSDVATLMRLSRETGLKTVIITEEPDLEALSEVMRNIQVRVVSGKLESADAWAAGTLNEDDITDYGHGNLQVVSLAKIGRLRSSIGTLRSPFMKSSYTTIDVI